jgi:uncharacterized protein
MNSSCLQKNPESLCTTLILSVLTLLLFPIGANGASFHCQKSHTFIEHAICSNQQLSKLDEKLDKTYKKTLEMAVAPDLLKQEQRVWLTDERNVCQDVTCLKRVYKQRLESLATYNDRERIANNRGPCEFPGLKLPEKYSIFAAGNYSGRKLNTQIDESGHLATQMDVVVNFPSKPVVLMFGAYEPTIWNVSWSQATSTVALLVSGYHGQDVAGLDATVPMLNTSYDNKGTCGYFYVGENDLDKLNPMSRRLFGRPVDMVYLAQDGKIVIGEAVPAGLELITSKAIPPESFYDKTAPRPGSAGLEDAVQKGLLRTATDADVDAWVRAVRASTPKRDVPPIAGQGELEPKHPNLSVTECVLSMDNATPCKKRFNAYVVLKQFTCPSGLYESSATFFIPKGVPRPKGNCGHSEIYDFNNLKCNGPGCAQ